MMKEAITSYLYLMPCNIVHSAQLIPICGTQITWDLIISWSLVDKARFVSVGIYHACASLMSWREWFSAHLLLSNVKHWLFHRIQ